MGLRIGLDGELAERAARLRATVDVALYTPRRPDGRSALDRGRARRPGCCRPTIASRPPSSPPALSPT